ncbi:MAG: hypothetical protein AAFX00_03725 [Pseudomonadota bacterium]
MQGEIAVLTGDIVRSRALPEGGLDRAFAALGRAAECIAEWQGASARLTRFRGDGWQMIVTDVRFVLRATLMIRAALRSVGKGLSTRIAVGVGAQGHIPDADLSSAEGDAFVISGASLDALPSRKRIAPGNAPAVVAMGLLLSAALADGWTETQAAVALLALSAPEKSQAEMARQTGTTQQNVQKLLEAAAFEPLQSALEVLEDQSAEFEHVS